MLSFKRMSEVKDQLEWIANHNYDSYDSPTSQSNGSVAVYKADVSKLLDYVDWADKYNEVDTDGMQITLNNAVRDAEDDMDEVRVWMGYHDVDRITKVHIIEKIEAWVATSAARGIIR